MKKIRNPKFATMGMMPYTHRRTANSQNFNILEDTVNKPLCTEEGRCKYAILVF